MPSQPKPGETKDEFLQRCIPEVLADETATDTEQALAVCSNMFDERKHAPFYEAMSRKNTPKDAMAKKDKHDEK
jgi:hypothetical protein